MKQNKTRLKREVGVLGLSANMINIIIGSGIFMFPAIMAAELGSASIIAYLFCGLLTILIMLCYAEIGSNITDTGGAYTYIERIFGKYPGFITAFLILLTTIAGDAAVSNAIADIIASIYPSFNNTFIRSLFFLVIFSGFGYINVIGLKYGISFVRFITLLKITPLLFIIFFGFMDVSSNNLHIESIPSIKNIGEMSLILFFAFQGASSALSISGEVKDPKKSIPKAIILTIVVVLIIYILIQTISQGILGDSLPEFPENPLGEVAKYMIGPVGFILLSVAAAISMFGTLSSKSLSIPRVIFAASKDEVIPIKKLSLVHSKYLTPHISIITYVSLGFLFASLGGFKQMAIISTSAEILIYLGISLSIIKLRKKKKDGDNKSFKIPGGYLIPFLSCIVCIWFLSNLPKNEFIALGLYIIILTSLYFVQNKIILKNIGKE